MPFVLFTIPILSTLIGGGLALRFHRHVALLTAIGAGILLGAAFLDLVPEAITLGAAADVSPSYVLALTLLSFVMFLGLDTGLHRVGRKGEPSRLSRLLVRRAGAGMLIFHSFRDGMAIGAAYAASRSAGYAVAFGIAAHDLGDGMNTVLLTDRPESARWSPYAFLLADAVAPFAGGLFTAWWHLSQVGAMALLILAAGFFLQMATGDFLPEMRNFPGPRRYLLLLVLLGAAVIWFANLLIASRH